MAGCIFEKQCRKGSDLIFAIQMWRIESFSIFAHLLSPLEYLRTKPSNAEFSKLYKKRILKVDGQAPAASAGESSIPENTKNMMCFWSTTAVCVQTRYPILDLQN